LDKRDLHLVDIGYLEFVFSYWLKHKWSGERAREYSLYGSF